MTAIRSSPAVTENTAVRSSPALNSNTPIHVNNITAIQSSLLSADPHRRRQSVPRRKRKLSNISQKLSKIEDKVYEHRGQTREEGKIRLTSDDPNGRFPVRDVSLGTNPATYQNLRKERDSLFIQRGKQEHLKLPHSSGSRNTAQIGSGGLKATTSIGSVRLKNRPQNGRLNVKNMAQVRPSKLPSNDTAKTEKFAGKNTARSPPYDIASIPANDLAITPTNNTGRTPANDTARTLSGGINKTVRARHARLPAKNTARIKSLRFPRKVQFGPKGAVNIDSVRYWKVQVGAKDTAHKGIEGQSRSDTSYTGSEMSVKDAAQTGSAGIMGMALPESEGLSVKDTAHAGSEGIRGSANTGSEGVKGTAHAGSEGLPVKDTAHVKTEGVRGTAQTGYEGVWGTAHTGSEVLPMKDTAQAASEGIGGTAHTGSEILPAKDTARVSRRTRVRPSANVFNKPHNNDGRYSFSFRHEDGSSRDEEGSMGPGVSRSIKGQYSYLSPEGKLISLSYKADHTGFHAEGDHVPRVGPLPPSVQRTIDHINKVNRLKQDSVIKSLKQTNSKL